MLCPRVVANPSTVLQCHVCNVTMAPARCIIPGTYYTMSEHACSSFAIKNDNGSEVCSPVDSLRVINEPSDSPYNPCICNAQPRIEDFLNWNNWQANILSSLRLKGL